MRLPAGTRRLEIDYTVINLTSALKTRFRYRLEGFDPDWIEIRHATSGVHEPSAA